MSCCYVLSVLYLFISFLLYPKSRSRKSIIEGIIYSIGLFFCYNTVVVYFNSLFHIQGSLLVFSIINFFVGTFLMIFISRKKKVQKYFFQKQEFFIALGIIVVLLGIGCYRFRGFQAISYESGDSGIHYRHALTFSKELSLFDKENSKDFVYVSFSNIMSISYINGGLILRLFSNSKPYRVFLGYDVFCLILCSLLFFVTISRMLKDRKKHTLYLFFITLIYALAYPLNSFLFGFCYLGLGVMVINLLYETILLFEQEFNKQFLFKMILLFMIVLSVFFSYYLFVPCVYLAVGLYYISLWRKKKIDFKKLLLYGGVTLIVPFLIGFFYFFILPRYQVNIGSRVSSSLSLWGYGYENILMIGIFALFSWYIIYSILHKREKINSYFNINLLVLTGYICLFLVLYVIHFISSYYFFKLFYLYWLFLCLWVGKNGISYYKSIYVGICLILLGTVYVMMFPNTKITSFLTWLDIYHWNTKTFDESRIIYTKEEVELVEKAIEYQDVCERNHRFVIIGDENKNVWFYSITDMIPTVSLINGDSRNLYLVPNLTLEKWNRITEYPCAIYFYEGKKEDYEKDNYEILYSNDAGIILKSRKT